MLKMDRGAEQTLLNLSLTHTDIHSMKTQSLDVARDFDGFEIAVNTIERRKRLKCNTIR